VIDTLTIILSTTICLFILFRAVRLDAILPWYPTGEAAVTAKRAWSPAWDQAIDASDAAPADPAIGPHRGSGSPGA
jgi:hypothetical protein